MKNKHYLMAVSKIVNVLLLFIIGIYAGCSRTPENYDDIEKAGRVENLVRKQYSGFFRTMKMLGEYKPVPAVQSDSLLLKKAASVTDDVIRDVRAFPATIESRLAIDALSYAARDLTVSPGFSQTLVSGFWEMALLNPIFTKGREYMKTGVTNASTQIQLVKSLQRGMGTKATSSMLEEAIPIVGPVPVSEVMNIAAKDSLVFRKIHDLILYSQSLQKIGPPLWMVIGPWFMAVTVEGFLPCFYSFVPILIDRDLYLSFKSFKPAEVYETLYHDPAPSDGSELLTWLTKVRAALDSMKFDDSFADRVKDCRLPIYDTHYLFDDYMVQTAGDSLKKEYYVTFKREKMIQNKFQYSGIDSIAVTFTQSQISKPEGKIITLDSYRYQGSSMNNGRYLPELSGVGKAYLMALGKHDLALLDNLRRAWMPKFTVNTK